MLSRQGSINITSDSEYQSLMLGAREEVNKRTQAPRSLWPRWGEGHKQITIHGQAQQLRSRKIAYSPVRKDHGLLWPLPVFVNEVCLNTSVLIHVCLVYGCHRGPKMAELSIVTSALPWHVFLKLTTLCKTATKFTGRMGKTALEITLRTWSVAI